MLYTHETLIREAFGAFGKQYMLVHVPTCIEPAGSGTREVNECYRVVHKFDGNRHSKAFKTLAEAEAELDRWTKPIVAQTTVQENSNV